MKNILRISAFGLPLVSLLVAGCPSDPAPADAFTPPTPDAFTANEDDAFVAPDSPAMPDAFVPNDAPVVITNDCAGYCAQMALNCTGANAQYIDNADCMAQCTALAWPAGTPGAMDGNTIACRIYHGGAPAVMDPAAHCPHAGPSGDSVCGAALTFRSEASSMATRVDRMGMPAVATATISGAQKNAYNDGNPSDDAMLTFAGDQIATLTGIHAALDDDLAGLSLTPCSMAMADYIDPDGAGPVPPLPECLGQEIFPGGGARVFQLVIPDTLRVNPTQVSRFPNGRDLDDPVIDVTLAAALLDLGTHTPATLASVPLNPPANAAGELLTTFPYFGVAAEP
jgi:hypothetical protein